MFGILGLSLFKIFMIVAIVGLAIGWGIYWYSEMKWRKERQENKQGARSEKLNKSKSEFADYIKKMAKFKKKTYDKKDLQ